MKKHERLLSESIKEGYMKARKQNIHGIIESAVAWITRYDFTDEDLIDVYNYENLENTFGEYAKDFLQEEGTDEAKERIFRHLVERELDRMKLDPSFKKDRLDDETWDRLGEVLGITYDE